MMEKDDVRLRLKECLDAISPYPCYTRCIIGDLDTDENCEEMLKFMLTIPSVTAGKQ